MARWGLQIRTVIGFFTRLPIPMEAMPLSEAAAFFPLAGFVIGALSGLVLYLAFSIYLPPMLCVLLAIGTSILLTGALHEDGLADTADALGARGSLEQRIAILKDSRIGTFGTLALIFSIAFKLAALSDMGNIWRMIASLMAAHILARAVLPGIMRKFPLLSSEGMAARAGMPSSRASRLALGIALLLATLLVGPEQALIGFASAILAAFFMGRVLIHRFGGYNGDILGAVEQIAEIAILINLRSFS